MLFDTGKIVITGGREVRNVNSVFFRVRELVPQFEEQGAYVPKDQRFARRFAKLLQDGFGKKLPPPKTKKKKTKEKALDEDEVIAMALAEAEVPTNSKRLRYDGDNDPKVTPFMKACDLGQYNNVETMMDMDPSVLEEVDSQGKNALQRLLGMDEEDKDPGGAHDKIAQLLKNQNAI